LSVFTLKLNICPEVADISAPVRQRHFEKYRYLNASYDTTSINRYRWHVTIILYIDPSLLQSIVYAHPLYPDIVSRQRWYKEEDWFGMTSYKNWIYTDVTLNVP